MTAVAARGSRVGDATVIVVAVAAKAEEKRTTKHNMKVQCMNRVWERRCR